MTVMKMKRYILAAACIAASAAAMSAQTDATLNNVTERFTLHPDGSIDRDYSKSLTYHTHYSFFNLFGETFVVYNPATQKLEIKECRTTQKDGTVIDAPANAFNEVLPANAAGSTDYNGLREMVITHTGLEPGCTVSLDYSVKGSPEGTPTLDIDRVIPVQGADIKEYKIVVDVPEGTPVNWSVTGSDVKPVINGSNYTWTFRNIPAASGDRFAPADAASPRLSVTTAASIEEALRPLTLETRDICRLPASVTEGKTTADEKAEAIHSFIVKSIAKSSISPALTGNRVRQCRRVLQTAFATEAEAALAMARLMRAEGIDAEAVAVFPKSAATRSIANISRYLVKAGDKFYSPMTTGTYNASLRADRDDIVTLGGKTVSVATASPVIAGIASIVVKGDSVSLVSDTCTVTGLNGTATFGTPTIAKRGHFELLTLPAISQGADSWGMENLASARTDAFELPSAIEETATYEIALDDRKSLTTDCNETIANTAGTVTYSVKNAPGKITVTRTLSLPQSIVPAARYADLRKLLVEWNTPARRRIILE